MTGLCESGDDSSALGRLRIFSQETNDYTIRAEQMRPDVRELLARIEDLEAALRETRSALSAFIDAWEGIDELFLPQMPRLVQAARAALSGERR